MTVIVLFMVLAMLFLRGNREDKAGHLGGAIVGLLYGLAFFPRIDTGIGPKIRKYAIFMFVLFFILMPVLFWTIEK